MIYRNKKSTVGAGFIRESHGGVANVIRNYRIKPVTIRLRKKRR